MTIPRKSSSCAIGTTTATSSTDTPTAGGPPVAGPAGAPVADPSTEDAATAASRDSGTVSRPAPTATRIQRRDGRMSPNVDHGRTRIRAAAVKPAIAAAPGRPARSRPCRTGPSAASCGASNGGTRKATTAMSTRPTASSGHPSGVADLGRNVSLSLETVSRRPMGWLLRSRAGGGRGSGDLRPVAEGREAARPPGSVDGLGSANRSRSTEGHEGDERATRAALGSAHE